MPTARISSVRGPKFCDVGSAPPPLEATDRMRAQKANKEAKRYATILLNAQGLASDRDLKDTRFACFIF
jgi:hypothetical protein